MQVRLVQRNERFHFTGYNAEGLPVEIDSPEDGAEAEGVSPLQLVPIALGACSGVDVVAILRKARQPLEGLEIEVTAERDGGKPISLIVAIHVHFAARGNLEPAKVERAVRLSLSTYCSVAALLRGSVNISASYGIGPDRYEVPDVMGG